MAIRLLKGKMMKAIVYLALGAVVAMLVNGITVGVWFLATRISKALFGEIDGFALFLSNMIVEAGLMITFIGGLLTLYVGRLFLKTFFSELKKAQANERTRNKGGTENVDSGS